MGQSCTPPMNEREINSTFQSIMKNIITAREVDEMNYREEVFNEIERYSSFNQKIILMAINFYFMILRYFFFKNIMAVYLMGVLIFLQV